MSLLRSDQEKPGRFAAFAMQQRRPAFPVAVQGPSAEHKMITGEEWLCDLRSMVLRQFERGFPRTM